VTPASGDTASGTSLGPSTYTGNIAFNNTTNNQGNATRAATLVVNPKNYTLAVSASPSAAPSGSLVTSLKPRSQSSSLLREL